MTKQVWLWPGSSVVRIVDGDTFVAKVHRDMDFGFHVIMHGEAEIKMRLNRINAPDVKTPAGQDSAAKLTLLMTLGAALDIETVGPYKYGDEWMAEVTLPNGANVSDEMVRFNLAVYWDGKGPRPGG